MKAGKKNLNPAAPAAAPGVAVEVEGRQVIVDEAVIKKYISLARKAPGKAFLVKIEGGRVSLVPNSEHRHHSDWHSWLPDDEACIVVVDDPFISRQKAAEDIVFQCGNKIVEVE